MITIVDNGKGTNEIAGFVRNQKDIVKPSKALESKANAFILSDGDMKHQKDNIKLMEKTNKPILAIGNGYLFLGAAYGAKTKPAKLDRTDRLKVEHPCPLTLDMKKIFEVVQSCGHVFEELPENFTVIASSPKYEFKIIEDAEKPFFGLHFNPELGGDGPKIIDNFVKFVEIWGKYHGR